LYYRVGHALRDAAAQRKPTTTTAASTAIHAAKALSSNVSTATTKLTNSNSNKTMEELESELKLLTTKMDCSEAETTSRTQKRPSVFSAIMDWGLARTSDISTMSANPISWAGTTAQTTNTSPYQPEPSTPSQILQSALRSDAEETMDPTEQELMEEMEDLKYITDTYGDGNNNDNGNNNQDEELEKASSRLSREEYCAEPLRKSNLDLDRHSILENLHTFLQDSSLVKAIGGLRHSLRKSFSANNNNGTSSNDGDDNDTSENEPRRSRRSSIFAPLRLSIFNPNSSENMRGLSDFFQENDLFQDNAEGVNSTPPAAAH
jgi:hypothetical protein